MKKSLLVAFVIAALHNMIMSVLGICVVLQTKGGLGYFASTIGALMLAFLPLSTSMIVSRKGRLYRFLKYAVVAVIFVNLYCSLVGHFAYLGSNAATADQVLFSWKEAFGNKNYAKTAFIVFLALLSTSASLILSFLRHEEDDEDERPFLRSRRPAAQQSPSIEKTTA